MTPQQEAHALKRIIRHQAFLKAVEAFQGQQLLPPADENTLVLRMNRDDYATIARNQDGTATADPSHIYSHRVKHSHSPLFTNSHQSLIHEISEFLKKFANDATGVRVDNHPELHQAGRHSLNETIHNTARSVITTLGNGHIQNSSRLGHTALRKLLGKEAIARTLKYFGALANIQDFNYQARNQEQLELAYQASPNALNLWLNHAKPADQLIPAPAPQVMIQQAKEHFIAAYNQTVGRMAAYRNREEHVPAEISREPTPEEAWDSFLQLNHTAINNHPNVLHIFLRIARIAAMTGLNPRPGAMTAIIRHPNIALNSVHLDLIHRRLFIETQGRRPIAPARELLSDIRDRAYGRSLTHQGEKTDIAGITPDTTLAGWASALDPEWDPGDTEPARPKPRKPRRGPTNPTKSRVWELMESPAAQQFVDAIQAPVTIAAETPGTVSLINNLTATPALSFVKAQDGTISLESDPELHLPTKTGLPAPQDSPQAPSAPSTQGLVRDIQTQSLMDLVATLRKDQAMDLPASRTLHLSIMRAIEARPHQFSGVPTDESESSQLQEAVRTLTDPATAGMCLTLTGDITLNHYNAAVRAGSSLTELTHTNPGAAAWALNTGILEQSVPEHPGQIIAGVKAQLHQLGLPDGLWRRTATLDPRLVHTALRTARSQHAAVTAIIALAQAANSPEPSHLTHIIQNVTNSARQDHHSHYITKLAIQESQKWGHETPKEFQKNAHTILDYLANLRNKEEAPSQKSWRKLLRASERWHRQIDEQRAQADWDQRLVRTNGRYSAWNSLIERKTIADYTFQALTDELQLMQETARMRHCVAGYGHSCATGESRIFQVFHQGNHLGTTEIAPDTLSETGTWTQTQTKGYKNADIGLQATLAANLLAKEYSRLFASAPEPHHRWEKVTQVPEHPMPYPTAYRDLNADPFQDPLPF